MIGFLAPFFIAFGIGAGIAAVLIILAAVSVTVRQTILFVWAVVKELVTWPRAFWEAIRLGIADAQEADRRRQAKKAAKR